MLKAVSLRPAASLIQYFSPLHKCIIHICCHRCKVPCIIDAHINQSFESRALRLLEWNAWLALGTFRPSVAADLMLPFNVPARSGRNTYEFVIFISPKISLTPTALPPVGLRSRLIVLSSFIYCSFSDARINWSGIFFFDCLYSLVVRVSGC
jgi:hypothetical protein